MEKNKMNELTALASEIRKDIVRMVGVARSGPLEIPLSISDLLVYIYWEEFTKASDNPSNNGRDRFLLGVGEGAPALYAVLARRGYFGREELWNYRRLGSMLQALPDYRRTPGIDAPCITSGTELAVASALAESLKKEGSDSRVLSLLSAESCCDPDFMLEAERTGSIRTGNLTVLFIICGEEKESDGGVTSACSVKLAELGWKVIFLDGHDFNDMDNVFKNQESAPVDCAPKAIFVKTKNGSGFSFARSEQLKNNKFMSMGDMDQALEELEGRIQ